MTSYSSNDLERLYETCLAPLPDPLRTDEVGRRPGNNSSTLNKKLRGSWIGQTVPIGVMRGHADDNTLKLFYFSRSC